MLINKTLSVLTLTLMPIAPIANVSTVIASHDNKDDNTNMSDTLKLSSSLSLSNSSVSDINSDNEEENSAKTTVITKEQQKPFDCDEPAIEKQSDDELNTSFSSNIAELIDMLTSSAKDVEDEAHQ